MSSQSDERFESAAEEARRNFEDARRQFDQPRNFSEPQAPKSAGVLGGVRAWCSRNLPGGERTLWVILILIGLIFVVWRLIPGNNAGQGGFGMNGPQPVGVAVASRGDIGVTLDALGTVTPLATVTVRPQVSGQLVAIAFTEGQMVKAGDLLAEIDPRTFQAALDQAGGALARDAASLDNARIDLKRLQALRKSNATSQQSLDTQAALVKQYEGAVMSDRANVETAKINLGYTRVTSPVAGKAGIRLVDLGNFVAAGQATGIVVVTQLDPISVLFSVPEDNIGDIVARMNQGAELRVDAYDRTQTRLISSGRLAAVDSQIDTTTGTVKLRAMFDNAEGALFPNQFVNVQLLVNTLHSQVVIPAAAIQRGAAGSYVFVVKPDKTAQMRTVTVGVQQGDKVDILRGLNPGETVVTDGADRLRDGGQVTIPSGQKVANVQPAENAAPIPESMTQGRRGNFALMRKLSPDECEKLKTMAWEERGQWFREHREELTKRPDQAGGGCRLGGGGGNRGGGTGMRGLGR